MLKLEDFTLAEYRALLERVRQGRANLCFGDFGPPAQPAGKDDPNVPPRLLRDGKALPERFCLLRHDVDYSPRRALGLARLEAEAGLRAGYFILLTGETYNLLSAAFRDFPRELVRLGHEVGLHYDLAILEAGGKVTDGLRRQADLLSDLSGSPVRSIAMHNPSLSGADPFAECADFVNAYDAAFTRDIAYFSDSCGAWRDQAHAVLSAGDIPPRLQLLIHPLLWDETPGDRWRRLQEWITQQEGMAHDLARRVEGIWRGHAGVAEHDRRQRRGK